MPAPVNGIRPGMKTIVVFDPSEVVFEKTKFSINRQAVENYGLVGSKILLSMQKNKILKKIIDANFLTNNRSRRIITNPIHGADEAINILSGLGKGNLELVACLNIRDEELVEEIKSKYSKISFMQGISDYVHLDEFDNSIMDVYSNMNVFYHANVIALVTSVDDAKLAKGWRLIPAIISKDSQHAQIAEELGGIYANSLNSFAKIMSEKLCARKM